MKLVQLLGVLICSSLVYESAAIDVGFEQGEQSFREGRDEDTLFLQKGRTADDVFVRILLLTVDGFVEYSNCTGRLFGGNRDCTGRRFSQDILDIVNDISFPAEAGDDFNDAIIEVVFGRNEEVLEISITGAIIIDDLFNEATESFVMVLEFDSADPSAEFLENMDVLVFNIIDDDDILLGFGDNAGFSFDEGVGVLSDIFSVDSFNDTVMSQQIIAVIITIFVDSSPRAATPDVDFRPVDGLYTYLLILPPGQSSVFLNPIEILDDIIVEDSEVFFIEVMVAPGSSGFSISLDNMVIPVIITDNDMVVTQMPPTQGPATMGGDPHYSIMLPSGQLLCFSVHGEKNFPFNLITNDLLQMNAFFIEDALREEITWIGSLGVVVQHTHYKKSNTTKIRFEAKEQMIYINNGVSLHARKVEKLTLANGKLKVVEAVRKDAEKKLEVEVELLDAGLTFSVRFVKKRHLDMAWKKVTKQPHNSHGIIGQFMRNGVQIDEVRKLLYLPNLAPVPVMRSSVWHFMERDRPDPEQKLCWQTMNPGYQGKRLIEGSYLDYLVDDVLSSDFDFNKKQ